MGCRSCFSDAVYLCLFLSSCCLICSIFVFCLSLVIDKTIPALGQIPILNMLFLLLLSSILILVVVESLDSYPWLVMGLLQLCRMLAALLLVQLWILAVYAGLLLTLCWVLLNSVLENFFHQLGSLPMSSCFLLVSLLWMLVVGYCVWHAGSQRADNTQSRIDCSATMTVPRTKFAWPFHDGEFIDQRSSIMMFIGNDRAIYSMGAVSKAVRKWRDMNGTKAMVGWVTARSMGVWLHARNHVYWRTCWLTLDLRDFATKTIVQRLLKTIRRPTRAVLTALRPTGMNLSTAAIIQTLL